MVEVPRRVWVMWGSGNYPNSLGLGRNSIQWVGEYDGDLEVLSIMSFTPGQNSWGGEFPKFGATSSKKVPGKTPGEFHDARRVVTPFSDSLLDFQDHHYRWGLGQA